MDGSRFDSLARRLATGVDRRQALRALAASGAAGLLTRLGLDEVDARRLGRRCNEDRDCPDRRGVTCARLARECRGGKRCCGKRRARCRNDCDCCRGYRCNEEGGGRGRCRRR